jgi:hypothetical protein
MIRSHGTKVTLTSKNVAEMRLIPRGSLRDRARPDTPVLAWDTNTPPLPRAEAGRNLSANQCPLLPFATIPSATRSGVSGRSSTGRR